MRNWLLLGLAFVLLNCESEIPPREPAEFAALIYPADNLSTASGIELGRQLFFDPALSGDGTVSCATCHQPGRAFADNLDVSLGVGGKPGFRNTPSLTNIGYLHQQLFWDGRADNLEEQALHPIKTPHEMGNRWSVVLPLLRKRYAPQFRKAFGIPADDIGADHLGKALAQYQRSLISADTKYDRVRRGELSYTPEEAMGEAIFFDFADDQESPYAGLPTGECAHCHTPPHFTNQRFFNNGLDSVASLSDFRDAGRGGVTGNVFQRGTFRTPGLRNVALTAPYMHDGSMATLAEVIDHYNSGGHYAENRSPNVRPLGLKESEKRALVAFLHTLTDSSFVVRHQSR